MGHISLRRLLGQLISRSHTYNRSDFGHCGYPVIIAPGCNIFDLENIFLEDNVYIAENCTLYGYGSIKIGEGTVIASNVIIASSEHDYDDPLSQVFPFKNTMNDIKKPVEIGKYAWIGMNSIILPGVKIGDGSVVGAGSMVTRNVGDMIIVAGNPAKEVGKRSVEEIGNGVTSFTQSRLKEYEGVNVIKR